MILVRDVFQLKFGMAKEAKALWKEGFGIMEKYGQFDSRRAMTDLTGDFYTFVMETTYSDLATYEKALAETLATPEFAEWYRKFIPLIESGRREIFTMI